MNNNNNDNNNNNNHIADSMSVVRANNDSEHVYLYR